VLSWITAVPVQAGVPSAASWIAPSRHPVAASATLVAKVWRVGTYVSAQFDV